MVKSKSCSPFRFAPWCFRDFDPVHHAAVEHFLIIPRPPGHLKADRFSSALSLSFVWNASSSNAQTYPTEQDLETSFRVPVEAVADCHRHAVSLCTQFASGPRPGESRGRGAPLGAPATTPAKGPPRKATSRAPPPGIGSLFCRGLGRLKGAFV